MFHVKHCTRFLIMDKYIYKIDKRFIGNTITFFDASLIGTSALYLDSNVGQEKLEKLYNLKHPSVIREKIKKIIKDDDENNG